MGNKRYYWLKLKEDFFDDDVIEWIEEQENGERYSLFYLKLCLKSLKTNGILIRNVGTMLIPYDVRKLAEVTRTDIDTVRVAMELFKSIGLVQILENGEIYLPQLTDMVGSETSKAELMRKKRKKDKMIALGNNVTDSVENCYTEIEIDIDKEKELEKESYIERELELKQEKELNNNNSSSSSGSSRDTEPLPQPQLEDIIGYAVQNKLTNVDCIKFYNYYSTIGWVTGKAKVPIKDWKFLLRKWDTEDFNRLLEKGM